MLAYRRRRDRLHHDAHAITILFLIILSVRSHKRTNKNGTVSGAVVRESWITSSVLLQASQGLLRALPVRPLVLQQRVLLVQVQVQQRLRTWSPRHP
jgi:hypothetical protein